MLVAWYILVSHLVQGQHKCSTKFYYTKNICVRYVTETVLKIRYSTVIVVFLTFNPLFDANILNDMISSLIL